MAEFLAMFTTEEGGECTVGGDVLSATGETAGLCRMIKLRHSSSFPSQEPAVINPIGSYPPAIPASVSRNFPLNAN